MIRIALAALAPFFLIGSTMLFYWALRLAPGTSPAAIELASILGFGSTVLLGFVVAHEFWEKRSK